MVNSPTAVKDSIAVKDSVAVEDSVAVKGSLAVKDGPPSRTKPSRLAANTQWKASRSRSPSRFGRTVVPRLGGTILRGEPSSGPPGP